MTTLTDSGQGYDVAINGLGFKLAISDERKYERATAQFRKEQFDSSQNYGDQSLLGYWTRGQFSFHKGAGVKYYDATEETVLNRFRDSDGVDPFTPGEVILYPNWAQATTTATFQPIIWAGAGNGFLALLASGVLKYATSLSGAASSYAPTAGTVTHATTGPLCAYVATTSSKIERVAIAAGAPATGAIYTHSANFNGIFYAKDRLWAVDVNGIWYQLSPNPTAPPVAIAAGDKVFTGGDGWDTVWSLTDTPGPVLIGNGGRIYSVTLDASTGAVPSMSGPVQVAELPTGETLRAMAYHLGFLALCTTAGVRIGVVSDSGAVTYGPPLVEWATPESGQTTIARRGSSVLIAGNGTLNEVDLAQQIGGGLEFAYAKRPSPFVAGATSSGAFTWAGSTVVAWDGASPPAGHLKREGTDYPATGSLTTGFHRFGTLEPKQFQSVRVRLGGATGGGVDLYRVDANGTETYLTTIFDTSTDFDYPLGLTAPVEMIALKFVLNSAAASSPVLLGYQLRALPAPKRQRLIRIPVLLMDVERRGVTRAIGHEGGAWERLAALEAMEQSGGVFPFQDFRTGETGTVYIESIEHAGTTPPGKQSNGFGGFVFLTLRKL